MVQWYVIYIHIQVCTYICDGIGDEVFAWFVVLGNHDYRGDVVAQLSSVFQKIDNRWLCMRSFIVDTRK